MSAIALTREEAPTGPSEARPDDRLGVSKDGHTRASWFETRKMRSSPWGATSASAIGRVAPGRDQQRHVKMPFRLADREAQRDLIEERRIGHRHLPFGKVLSDAKRQLIAADRHWPAADQRLVGA